MRHRLVEHDGAWCDATRAFNLVAEGSAVERASAFAQVAAAPWFDGVSVLAARETAPGLVQLQTHARTNGIVADWTVVVDRAGIVRATWTATQIAVKPFEPQTEGLTALPGLTRAYERSASGLVELTSPILPALAPPEVRPTVTDTYSDGFRIQFHHGATGVYPSVSEPLPLDVVRAVTRENYEEFLSWGLHKGWSSNLGHVYVDDDTAAACFACVYITQSFNIHISSGIVPLLRVIADASYPDDRAALSTVLGHEMFHNFQNAYSKPSGGLYMAGAYSEGLARFSETLHTYSGVSHQPQSLVYSATANGCNHELGFQSGSPTLHDGPATGQSYSACDFWLTYHGHRGVDGLVALLEASPRHREKSGWDEIRSVVEDATGEPVEEDLAAFAAALLSGEGLAWGPAAGAGPTLDWNEHLLGWSTPTLSPGGSLTQTIRDGGMMGARVVQSGVVTTDQPALPLYVVRDDGSLERIASGASVAAPAWVVTVLPDVGTATPTLSYA